MRKTRIRHVAQREGHDCAVACLTMLTGTPYEIILEGIEDALDDFKEYGISNADLAIWLTSWHHEADSGTPPWRSRSFRPYRAWNLADLASWPRSPHVASIRERSKGPCHVVVVANGCVFDPEMDKPWPMRMYERIGFRLIALIAEPDVLEACATCVG